MKYDNWLKVAVLACVLTLAGCSRSVSGSYFSQNVLFAQLLQLTETPDKHLIGTIQTVTLQDNGSLERDTANVTGAVDGDTVAISIEAGFLGGSRNVSGKISGQTIDLIVPAKGNRLAHHAVYTKADVAQFETASNELLTIGNAMMVKQRLQQQKAAAAQARQQRVDQMDSAASQLAKDLNTTTASQKQLSDRVGAISKRYADYVGHARVLLQKERQLLAINTNQSRANARVVHSNLAFLTSKVKSMDRDVRNLFTKWDQVFARADVRILETQRYCQEPSGNTAMPLLAHSGTCQQLMSAIALYRTSLSQMKADAKAPGDSIDQAFAEVTRINSESDSLLK